MKLTTNRTPDILQFVIRHDKKYNLYISCMWAVINLDLAHGIMSAVTDCGNYAYRWHETGVAFLKLMSEVNYSYFIKKIAQRTEFDLESSIECIIDTFDDWEEEQARVINLMSKLKGRYIDSAEEFIDRLNCLDKDGLLGDIGKYECIRYDYGPWAKTFAKIFIECVQPAIKEYRKEVRYED